MLLAYIVFQTDYGCFEPVPFVEPNIVQLINKFSVFVELKTFMTRDYNCII
jgi:hypothetical protein